MRYFIHITGLLLLVGGGLLLLGACKEPAGKHLPLPGVHVELVDSFGRITFIAPNRYDTSFSWINRSDCGPSCERQEYRLQPKNLRTFKESGWFYRGEPTDSVDQLTISHSRYVVFYRGDTSQQYAREVLAHNIEMEGADPSHLSMIFARVEKIGDRYFSILAAERKDSVHAIRVWAETNIRRNRVRFQCDLLTRKEDTVAKNFIKNSIDLIRTIRVKERPIIGIDQVYSTIGEGRLVKREELSPGKYRLETSAYTYIVDVVDSGRGHFVVSRLGKGGKVERTYALENRFGSVNCFVEVGEKGELGYYKVRNREKANMFLLGVNSVEGDRKVKDWEAELEYLGNERFEFRKNELGWRVEIVAVGDE